jgi:6,7-dimethyl-8-ribityllumazine synthase
MAEPRRQAVTIGNVTGARVLVIEARYYEEIGELLWIGAERALQAAGVQIERVQVPGALEIPVALSIAAGPDRDGGYHGAVALGCVIRGETSHYDVVAGESARALMDFSVRRGFPVGNGILTVDTEDQALARAKRDKGGDAARAALTLIALKQRLATRAPA